MEGRLRPVGMSEEQFAEAQHLWEVTEQAMADERWADVWLDGGPAGLESTFLPAVPTVFQVKPGTSQCESEGMLVQCGGHPSFVGFHFR